MREGRYILIFKGEGANRYSDGRMPLPGDWWTWGNPKTTPVESLKVTLARARSMNRDWGHRYTYDVWRVE